MKGVHELLKHYFFIVTVWARIIHLYTKYKQSVFLTFLSNVIWLVLSKCHQMCFNQMPPDLFHLNVIKLVFSKCHLTCFVQIISSSFFAKCHLIFVQNVIKLVFSKWHVTCFVWITSILFESLKKSFFHSSSDSPAVWMSKAWALWQALFQQNKIS